MALAKEIQCTQWKTCDSVTLSTISLKAYQLRSQPGPWWWEFGKWLLARWHCPLTHHSSLSDNIYTAGHTVHTQLSLGNYLCFFQLCWLTWHINTQQWEVKDNCREPRHILARGLRQTLPTELTTRTHPAVLGAEHTHVLIRGLWKTLYLQNSPLQLQWLNWVQKTHTHTHTHTCTQTNTTCRTHHYYCACCIKCRTH